MIYTSYFGNLKKLPKNIIPISICGKAPDWWDGMQYKRLAPKYQFFIEWKKNKDNGYYIEQFKKEILDNLDASEVVMELEQLCDKQSNDIALICYEKSEDFCHRHLVSNWLRLNGFKCEEWRND